MARLTSFSKLLIAVTVVAGVYFGGKLLFNYTDFGKKILEESGSASDSDSDPGTIKIGVVTWGGYAGGQYFNEGFKANTQSRFYKDYGFKVDFKVLDDFDASARTASINARRARAIVQEVREAVARWPEFADAASVGEDWRKSIDPSLRTTL